MPWEDVESVFRPKTAHMGVMAVDSERCTRPRGSRCQLCFDNCPFRAWEMVPREIPRQKAVWECFSCYNCMVACPRDAISITEPYRVDDGFWATDPHPLPAKMPVEPRDAEGNPTKWNAMERAVFHRRSVRNDKDKPVPEPLIRRVLEAGRFAPSAGNCQPWKFVAVTDRALIKEMDEAIIAVMTGMYNMYMNEELVVNLVPMFEGGGNTGTFDPRLILGGFGSIAKGYGPPFLNAPAVILILGDQRAISGAEMNVGICGQIMNLVANSLGIRSCWVGFSQVLNMVPPLVEKLGIEEPWRVNSSLVLGYPRFKQEGVVAREYRPVTWFREGSNLPEVEE